MKIISVLLVAVFHCALAYQTCDQPEDYYGTYVNNPLADKCKVGKRGVNDEGIRAQCVGIVKQFCGAPSTGSWTKGTRVNDDMCDSIPKYTPIASFTGSDDSYDGGNGHAGIFISCSDGDIEIADQYCGKVDKFNVRTLPKTCNSNKPASNCADYFYTIEY